MFMDAKVMSLQKFHHLESTDMKLGSHILGSM